MDKLAHVSNYKNALRVVSYLDDVVVEVYDISGNRLLRQSLYSNEEVTFDLLSNVYIVKTKRGDRMETQKIVVR